MSNFFTLIGAEKHNSEKGRNNIQGNKNEVRISLRRSGKRKALAINFPSYLVENTLNWVKKDSKIKVDIYIKKSKGIGIIVNDDGKYTLSVIRKKDGSASCYETRFNMDHGLISDNLDFINNPIKTGVHNENGIKFLWIEINQ